MRTIILKTAASYLLPLLLLFSVFIFLRGHYHPGGGFVGGLIASTAFVLYSFAYGLRRTKKMIGIQPGILMPIGLSLSMFSALMPIFLQGDPYMKALWMEKKVPVLGALGTPMLFDLGVYLVVLGVTLTIIFSIKESA